MKTKLLLPNRFKRIGWFIFIPCLVMTVVSLIADMTESFGLFNFFNGKHLFFQWTSKVIMEGKSDDLFASQDFMGEILLTLTAMSFFLVAFTKERQEDEWIEKVRLESLLWGFYGHLLFFLLAVWAGYSLNFYVFLSWNMLVAPLVFLFRFHWLVYVKPYFEERRATA
jgi:hypothetical protein